MKVQFHDIDEFLEELTRDADLIDRRIVRVSRMYRRHSQLPLRDVSVVATAAVGVHLLRLDVYIGEQMPGIQEDNNRLAESAKAVIDKIISRCRELGLEDRAGLFEV